MSVRKGNKIVSGRGKNGTGFALFTPKFFDYILNNPSWLRADTFSWHSGELYKSAYEHLYNDFTNLPTSTVTYYAWSVQGSSSRFSVLYTLSETPSSGDDVYVEKTSGIVYGGSVNSISGTTIEAGLDADGGIVVTAIRDSSLDETKESNATYLTETIGSTTINYFRTSDGHKIVMPDQESNVESIYQEVGVSWYYILDTDNKLFKLPRTKYSFTGLRDFVGNFVEAGLPNITGRTNFAPNAGIRNDAEARGSFYTEVPTTYAPNFTSSGGYDLSFDASLSSEVYGKSDTVQPNSTQMYLYFYVGYSSTEDELKATYVSKEELEQDYLDRQSIDKNYISKNGGTFNGSPIVKANTSGGNKIGLTVSQDWNSADLYTSFVEGRTGVNQNKTLGRIGFKQTNTHTANFWVQAFDPSTNLNKGQVFVAGYNGADNRTFLAGVTPPMTVNNTELATTAWVNKKIPTIINQPLNTTTLWSGNINSGDVALSEPFTNFEGLIVTVSSDEGDTISREYVSTYLLNASMNDTNFTSVILFGRYYTWVIKSYAQGSSTTFFKYHYENCRLRLIQGINRK